MPESVDLLALQRDFLGALREPLLGEGRRKTMLPPRAGEASRSFTATAERHLVRSKAADSAAPMQPVERLDLYHRQYWYRVLDSLEEDFPALKALLGDDRFRTLMEDYLEATPSRSATLRHLGSQMAAFVGANPHLAGRHAVAAAELAALEYALCFAFEAAQHDPVEAEQLEDARLALQPHVQLFALRTPADLLWRHTATAGAHPGLSEPAGEAGRFVVVFRDGFNPTMEAVDAEAFRLLSSIAAGATLAGAVEASGLEETPESAERLQRWFASWTARGWLLAAS